MRTDTRPINLLVSECDGYYQMKTTKAEHQLLKRLRQLKDAIVTIVVHEGEPTVLETTGKLEILGETHTR